MLYGKHWESERTEMEMDSIRPNDSRFARFSLPFPVWDGASRIGRRRLSLTDACDVRASVR